MKKCKVCEIEKEHKLLKITEKGTYVYVDAEENIWHGKTCYECFKGRLRKDYSKVEQRERQCLNCGVSFIPKRITGRMCTRNCIVAFGRK